MTIRHESPLRVVHSNGFEISLERGTVTYSEATLSSLAEMDASSWPVRLAPPAWSGLIAARVVGLLVGLGLDVEVPADQVVDAGELVPLLLEQSPPSAVEVVELLDALSLKLDVVLELRDIALGVRSSGDTQLVIAPVQIDGAPACFRLAKSEVLAVIVDAVAPPGIDEADLALRWDADVQLSRGRMTRQEYEGIVRAPAALVEVVPRGSTCAVSLAVGEDAAGLSVRGRSATYATRLAHASALAGLSRALWGDGTRPSGLCDLRVISAAGTTQIDRPTEDPEQALSWVVETLEALEGPPA